MAFPRPLVNQSACAIYLCHKIIYIYIFIYSFASVKEDTLANRMSEDVQRKAKFMYFLLKECADNNHNVEEDICATVVIGETKNSKVYSSRQSFFFMTLNLNLYTKGTIYRITIGATSNFVHKIMIN